MATARPWSDLPSAIKTTFDLFSTVAWAICVQIIFYPDSWLSSTIVLFRQVLVFQAPKLRSMMRAATIHQSDVINKIRTTADNEPILGLGVGLDPGPGVGQIENADVSDTEDLADF